VHVSSSVRQVRLPDTHRFSPHRASRVGQYARLRPQVVGR